MSEIDRRTALGAAAMAGAVLPLLAACGNDTHSAGSVPQSAAEEPGPLISTADVPVGGGVVIPARQVVVTQPSAGQFKCFTSICTHQQCQVTRVDEHIDCSCHGSEFSISDGSVVRGPAKKPLAEKQITVTGEQISLG